MTYVCVSLSERGVAYLNESLTKGAVAFVLPILVKEVPVSPIEGGVASVTCLSKGSLWDNGYRNAR